MDRAEIRCEVHNGWVDLAPPIPFKHPFSRTHGGLCILFRTLHQKEAAQAMVAHLCHVEGNMSGVFSRRHMWQQGPPFLVTGTARVSSRICDATFQG